ncbi:PepSY-associated TM helix domain-containing protein [Saccharopolyspora sp. 5N102]|uniref:PepSY-associated TM helix domain-containing protein n=1 Tax=Saccharopolyspora sp. 5N102 TaxID=3375155 RepID=UPI00378D4C7E
MQNAAAADVGPDRVLRVAAEHGVTGAVEITPPAKPGAAYTVQQIQRQWPTQQDSVAIDPASGQVTETLRFADYPLMAKLSRWGIDAHMGLLFGWVNQIVLAALMVGLLCMIFWGYRMWWLRRPTRGGSFGKPPERGTWRRVPGKVMAPVILVTVFVGYFLPLLGGSLLVFLAVDIGLGAQARRRARATVGA